MDFIDRIEELANRIPKQIEYCTTEEATKNALVLPFIQALGYDVFNPAEVMPEMTADFGTKKGEKVDYAILRDGKPTIVFECKRAQTDLGGVHASQLYRYFSVLPEVRFGVLTNGVIYQFYSDLDAPNRMDDKPFFVFDVLSHDQRHVAELKKFTKPAFDLEEILETASELKYTAAIKRIVSQEFDQPSDEFVTFLARQVYSGKITKTVRERFGQIVQKALRRFMNDQISDRLKSALEATGQSEAGDEAGPEPEMLEEEVGLEEGVVREDRARGIVTTEEEIEGYFAVKSILRETIDLKRLHLRDTKTYCNVLLDDTNRKPVLRMHFNRAQKYIGLFDRKKQEERVAIDDVDDIYDYGDRIVAAVRRHDDKWGVPAPARVEAAKEKALTFTGTKPKSFTFGGIRHEVGSWRDVMMGVLELLRQADQTGFEREAVKMVGRKRPYVTFNASELRAPERVANTDLFVETNLSSQMIANLCVNLAERMGFAASDLSFEVS